MKPHLVVTVALGVVEKPLSARFAAQATDEVLFAGAKTADATDGPVRFPFLRVQPSLVGEWRQHIIAFFPVSFRMTFLASEKQADAPEFRCEVVQADHGKLLRCHS